MSPEEICPLTGMCVSFTGRGMSFNRTQAQQIVEQLGGDFRQVVGEATSLLVIGAAGWPLQKNGRLTKNLDLAKRLQAQGSTIVIETEEDFLARIGSDPSSGSRVYSLAQLSRYFDLSAQQLSAWNRIGLLHPTKTLNDVAYYDFQQVVRCRTLADLVKSKVGRKRIHRVIQQLRRCQIADSILDRILLVDSQLAIRGSDGLLHTPEGQQLFDFSPSTDSPIAPLKTDTEDLFGYGVDLELSGKLGEAEKVYRSIIANDPEDSDVHYNLANVLTELRRTDEAIKQYREALFHDPDFAEAWNNLGNALSENKKSDEAVLAYRQALRIDPHFACAVYGLGCALDECGRAQEAEEYWRQYLVLEPEGRRADYAHERLRSN